MAVASILAPWPWPSRFSKDVQTVVRIPPEKVSEAVSWKVDRELTFPWSNILREYREDDIDRVKIEISANLMIL